MSGSQDLAVAWCTARRVEVGIKSERDEEQKKRLCVWGGRKNHDQDPNKHERAKEEQTISVR